MADNPDRRQSRILLVEDDPVQEAIVCDLLRAQGFVVASVGTLHDARDRLAGEPPDLLLLDRMLPDGEGLALCEALRADPAFRELPIILITARDGVEDRVEGLMRGADDYIPKPFHPKEFLARVHGCLRTLALQRELREQAEELANKNRLLLETQAKLVQSERLAAIGEVGLAIRHEINNPLGSILGFTDLMLLQRGSLAPEQLRKLELIRRATLRIRDVVRKLEELQDERPVEYLPGVSMTNLSPPPPAAGCRQEEPPRRTAAGGPGTGEAEGQRG